MFFFREKTDNFTVWFAAQEQTSTSRRQKYASLYLKFNAQLDELFPSFPKQQKAASNLKKVIIGCTTCIYFICCLRVKLLHVRLPKPSTYVKSYDGGTNSNVFFV